MCDETLNRQVQIPRSRYSLGTTTLHRVVESVAIRTGVAIEHKRLKPGSNSGVLRLELPIRRRIVAFPGAALFAGCAKGALAFAFAVFFSRRGTARRARSLPLSLRCHPERVPPFGTTRRAFCVPRCCAGDLHSPLGFGSDIRPVEDHAPGVQTPELACAYGGDKFPRLLPGFRDSGTPPSYKEGSPPHSLNVAQAFGPKAFSACKTCPPKGGRYIGNVKSPPAPCRCLCRFLFP